jgi:hypothetical protein
MLIDREVSDGLMACYQEKGRVREDVVGKEVRDRGQRFDLAGVEERRVVRVGVAYNVCEGLM